MMVFKRLIVAIFLLVVTFCLSSQAQSQGDWPIKGLVLTGPANGGSFNFTNLNQVMATNVVAQTVIAQTITVTNITVGTLITTNLTSSNTYTKAEVDVMTNGLTVATVAETNRAQVAEGVLGGRITANSNMLESTTFGSEGFRHIGALGGNSLAVFSQETAMKGVSRDGPVFSYFQGALTNLNVSWTDGDVYDPETGYYRINAGSIVLQDNANNFAYWSVTAPNVVSWTTGTRANITNDIIPLTSFACNLGRIIHSTPPTPIGDMVLRMDDAHYQIFPSIIKDGLNFYPTGTNFNQIAQVGGIEVHNMIEDNTHPAKNFTNDNPVTGNYFNNYFHTNSSSWGTARTNSLDIAQYDNGTNLVSTIVSNWYRGLLGSGAGTRSAYWIYPVGSYTNYADALAADDPEQPSGFDPYIPRCTAYIFQGGDTNLRTSSDYWIDRRFMIKRGTMTVSSGGGGNSTIPSLFQVLTQGKASGGLLMDGLGDPANDDQVSSKHYVDSKINQNNAGKAFVSGKSGNDSTAQLDSAIKPYKTIQAAINAAAVVATDTNRYLVDVAPGIYHENITMKDDVGLRGPDIEAVQINGTVTYPPAYVDESGAEIALMTIRGSNAPVLVCNPGSDLAYMGIRSCYLTTTYDNDATNKSLVTYTRGIGEDYGTSYHELIITPTNGSGGIRNVSVFEHTTDPSNSGLSRFTVFNASAHITSSDTNDDIILMHTHDNTDAKCINTALGTALDISLDQTSGIYTNWVKIIHHDKAQGRTLSMGTVTRIFLGYTNNVNVAFGTAENGTADNVAIIRGNHVRMSAGSTSNIWLGAAVGPLDRLRVYDSVYINNYSDFPYPKIYTNNGAAGTFFVNTVVENGDQLFGSAVDFSIVNSTAIGVPAVGHLKQYVSPYAGLENMYLKDSSGNTMRTCRDNFYNGYNDDTTDMPVGTAVYISDGLSADNTPKVKKSIASDYSTLPCVGVVAQIGGISTGKVGRIMIMGRLEQGMDTSMFTSGQKIYLSETVKGGLTNVPPTGTNYVQIVATAHIINSSNGYLSVRPWAPDGLGGLPPASWARSTNTSNWDNAWAWVSDNSNGISYTFGRTNLWDTTAALQQANSNGVAYVFTRTGAWDIASVWVGNNSNAVQNGTQNWNNAWSWITSNSNGIAYAFSRTNAWDADNAWYLASSGGVAYVFMRTGVWDTASVITTWASNNTVAVSNDWYGSVAKLIASADTQRWNIAGLTAIWASNNTVTVSNSWYGSVAYLIASADTQRWNIAGLTATWASNGVVALNGLTTGWNTASVTATWASNNTVAVSNSWYGSVAYLIASVDTQRWNNAYNYAVATSNDWYGSVARLIVSADTQRWNTAGLTATWASNGVVSLNGLTTGWNTASVNATWASNNTVAVSNSWYGSVAYLITSIGTQNWNNAWNWVTGNSNNIVQSTNKVWDINGNTNNYQIAYNWVNANSNKDAYVFSRTGTWDTASVIATWASNNTVAVSNSWYGSVAYLIASVDTQNWNTSYNWVNANSNLLSASSIVSSNSTAGVVVGAAATGTISFTNTISLATSSNFIISADGAASHTAGANNARGCNAYIYASWNTGFTVSNLIGQVWMTAANVSPSTNILHGYAYAKNITNNQIKITYVITSVGAGSAGLFTNFDMLIEPK